MVHAEHFPYRCERTISDRYGSWVRGTGAAEFCALYQEVQGGTWLVLGGSSCRSTWYVNLLLVNPRRFDSPSPLDR